jgi:hypothetical protein
MHFKNYKSSELYIILNLIHLISIPSYLSSIYHAPWHYPLVLHPSLSLARFVWCPDSGACADPTTIAVARTRARTPLADCGSSHAAMTVGPTSHLSLYHSSPCMATTYSYIRGKWSKTKHPPRQYSLLPFTTQTSKAHRQHACTTSM